MGRVLRAIIAATVWCAAVFASADVFSRAYGPKGVLYVDRPTLQWQVWAASGAELTRAWVKFDGRTLSAEYDSERRLASFTPSQSLAPGSYSIEMGVRSDDGLTVRKEWRLEVRMPPILAEPRPGADQVLTHVNAFRRALNLPDAYPLDPLDRAAKAHLEYLVENAQTGHYQSANGKLYTGATPSDRLNAFGYVGGSMEVCFFGRSTVAESVAGLIAAPYHRFAFMQPGRIPAGSAFGGDRLVIDFGEGEGIAVRTYPYDGQCDVPILWKGNERPNPLRLHSDIRGAPGFPIVFGRFSADPSRISLVSASLHESESGRAVPLAINHPDNDNELTDAVILFPKGPLKPGTGYRAEVECKDQKGARYRREWRFATVR